MTSARSDPALYSNEDDPDVGGGIFSVSSGTKHLGKAVPAQGTLDLLRVDTTARYVFKALMFLKITRRYVLVFCILKIVFQVSVSTRVFFLKENVRYPVSTCRDPKNLYFP